MALARNPGRFDGNADGRCRRADLQAGSGEWSAQVIRNLGRFWSRKGGWLYVRFPFVTLSTEVLPVVPAKVPRRQARQVEVCGSNDNGDIQGDGADRWGNRKELLCFGKHQSSAQFFLGDGLHGAGMVIAKMVWMKVCIAAKCGATSSGMPHSFAISAKGFDQAEGGTGKAVGTGCVLRRLKVAWMEAASR